MSNLSHDIEFCSFHHFFISKIFKVLFRCMFVTALSMKLFSTIQIITHEDTIFFDENECVIQNKKIENVIFQVIKCRSSYSLNLIKKIEIYTTNAVQFEHVMTVNDDAMNF